MFMFFKTNFYYFSLVYLGVLLLTHSRRDHNYQGAMLLACSFDNSHKWGVGYDDWANVTSVILLWEEPDGSWGIRSNPYCVPPNNNICE